MKINAKLILWLLFLILLFIFFTACTAGTQLTEPLTVKERRAEQDKRFQEFDHACWFNLHTEERTRRIWPLTLQGKGGKGVVEVDHTWYFSPKGKQIDLTWERHKRIVTITYVDGLVRTFRYKNSNWYEKVNPDRCKITDEQR